MSIDAFPPSIATTTSDDTLDALAGLSTSANTMPFFTGVDTAALTPLTPFMRTLLDDPDLATAQGTLGITGGGGGAPTDAEYIVGSAHGTLTQERVLTTTTTVAWDLATAGQAKANVPDASITEVKLGLSDVTTQNVSTTAHGLTPKLSGVATQYLDGTGLWTVPPAGTTYTDEQAQDAIGAMLVDTATIDLTYGDGGPTLQADVKDLSITEAKLTFVDVTTQDASTTAHGLLRKLSGTATQYLDGSGGWTTPAGSGGTTYWSRVDAGGATLATGCLAFWNLEEATGNRLDSIGTSHLVPTGAPPNVTSAAGKIGQALAMNGTGGTYLSVADTATFSAGPTMSFTVACWIYLSDVGNNMGFVGKGSATPTSNFVEYMLWQYSGAWRFQVGNGSSNVDCVSSFTPVTNQWCLLIGWYDHVADVQYIQVNNGTPTSAVNTVGSYDSTEPFQVGRTVGIGSQSLNGRIDLVGFWKRVLTADERTEYWNSGNGVAYPFGTPGRLTPTTVSDQLLLAASALTNERLEVDGAIKVGTTTGTTDGIVRWTGTDMEARKGGAWVSMTGAGGGAYTNEEAQDAVGTILVDTATIDLIYTDATPSITADVRDASITYAKIQNVTDARLLGRSAGSAGVTQELTVGAGLALSAGVLTSTITQYTTELAQDAIGTILLDTATIDLVYDDATPTLSAAVVAGSIGTTHLTNDAVTYAKLQNVTDARLLGRSAGSAGDAQEITVGTGLTLASGTLTAAGGGGGAPIDAEYIVSNVHATLTADRQLTDSATLAWNRTIPNQMSASVPDSSITVGKIQNIAQNTLLGRSSPGTGAPEMLSIGAGLNIFSGQLYSTTTDQEYLVRTASTALSAERVVTNGVNTTWDFSTPGVAVLNITPALGTMAQQDAANVAITGGYAQGLTSLGTTGTLTAKSLSFTESPSGDVIQLYSTLNAPGGASRWFIYHAGTGPAYLGGALSVVGTAYLGGAITAQSAAQFNGPVGIGTSPGLGPLELRFLRSTQNGIILRTDADAGAGGHAYFMNASGGAVGSITCTASATAFNTSSDVRLKHAITPLTGALSVVRALRPVHFLWNANDEPGEGFLAHELMRQVPAAVTGLPDEVNEDGSVRPQQVDHSRIVPWLVGALQDTLAQVQALAERVWLLEQQLGV